MLYPDTSSSSHAHSTTPILPMQFEPPHAPFHRPPRRDSGSSASLLHSQAQSSTGFVSPSPFSSPSRSRNPSPAPGVGLDLDPHPSNMPSDGSNVSLSVNYVPSKFSAPGGPRRRTPHRSSGGKGTRRGEVGHPGMPKMGGGVDAFRSGEARIGGPLGEDDDDDIRVEDASHSGWARRDTAPPSRKGRWNRFKWVLLIANLVLTVYSLVALVLCLLTWFNVWEHADVIRTGNEIELTLSTLAAAVALLTALIGWAGILLNNRSFLAVYTFLLWIVFALILIPGYLTYKRRTFNLEGKVNAQWSQTLGESGRLRIQNELQCCGYFSPFVEATVSQTCYARSILPGCKAAYLVFERRVLGVWFKVAFAIVPLHLVVMIAGLLCSNHVTYRFGKGMMPKAYRLSVMSMAVIMDNYASQLAQQYGDEIATDVLARSRSNTRLDAMPTMPYQPPTARGMSHSGSSTVRYNSLPLSRDKEDAGLM